MAWYKVSLEDGGLTSRSTAPPKSTTEWKWKENFLTSLMALNQDLFLIYEDNIPLCLTWSETTVMSPDMVYIDVTGRVTIVELKSEKATTDSIIQLLSYSEHWRWLPFHKFNRFAFEDEDHHSYIELLGEALAQIQNHNVKSARALSSQKKRSLGSKAVNRIQPKWFEAKGDSLLSMAKNYWGDSVFPFIGMPARLILIAPDFDEGCKEMAKKLYKRCVDLELKMANFRKTNDDIYFYFKTKRLNFTINMQWVAMATIWEETDIMDKYSPLGWAEPSNNPTLSLAHHDFPALRIYLTPKRRNNELVVSVSTTIPDGWFKNDQELRAQIHAKLKKSINSQGRWLGDEKSFNANNFNNLPQHVTRIADALEKHLIPHAPKTVPSTVKTFLI